MGTRSQELIELARHFGINGASGEITYAGRVTTDNSNGATSGITGSIQTDGGIGVAGPSYIDDKLTVSGDLIVDGNYINSITSLKTTDYTVLVADSYVLCGHATVPFTITLFAASSNAGRVIGIKNVNVAAVTVDTLGGNIDGSSTLLLDTQYASVSLVSDGTNWHIM